MNCQDFEQLIGDLARRRPLDAGARRGADSHEQECARCAARLADERALSAGLKALAATMKESEAPARVEGALLAAFRARAAEDGHSAAPAASAKAEELPSGVLPFVGAPNDRQWSWRKTLGTAATAAAAAAVALAVLVPKGTPTKATKTSPAVAAVTPQVETTPAPRGGESERDAQTAQAAERDSYEADPPGVIPQRVASAPRAGGRVQAVTASYSNGGSRGGRQARAYQDEPEVMTEFFPVAQGGGLASGEGGHVVRVELPRSALASFGLPVNVEQSGGRVKADVLLGEDGTARAIRFVR
ncbi:MAG TPA: hypothetical protein VGX48_05395 [Pyrinomonadaceae bacterium]|jgi:hypothetical protein|nr:hypothetical protein [Pyrinomonadaceae bacterium]